MNRSRTLIVTLLIILLACTIVVAQTSDNPFLKRLRRDWRGEGNAFGHPAFISMKWEPVLEYQFYQISYKIITHEPDGKTIHIFAGTGYYKAIASTHFEGIWLDSQGSIHPLTASCDDSSLTTLWGKSETQLGKTIYRFVSPDAVEITDFIMKKDSTWKEFSRNIVNRMNVFYDTLR